MILKKKDYFNIYMNKYYRYNYRKFLKIKLHRKHHLSWSYTDDGTLYMVVTAAHAYSFVRFFVSNIQAFYPEIHFSGRPSVLVRKIIKGISETAVVCFGTAVVYTKMKRMIFKWIKINIQLLFPIRVAKDLIVLRIFIFVPACRNIVIHTHPRKIVVIKLKA